MLLEELTLNNFCLYKGRQTFELAPSRKNGSARPIVLCGGDWWSWLPRACWATCAGQTRVKARPLGASGRSGEFRYTISRQGIFLTFAPPSTNLETGPRRA
jgi:hypothetical protein